MTTFLRRVSALFLVMSCVSSSVAVAASPDDESALKVKVAQRLAKTFRNFTADDIRPSKIPGLYEVVTGTQVLYYAPDADVMVFGELYSTDGKSLTAARRDEIRAEKAKTIDETAGTAVGSGPVEVLAFVDPDCGYCRKAHEWMKQQQLLGRIKEVVYFMPIGDRADARARAENLVCAPDSLKGEALDQIWRKAPAGEEHPLLKCDRASSVLAAQAEQARKFGVTGTPTFVVGGKVVTGFDQAQLTSLLMSPEIKLSQKE